MAIAHHGPLVRRVLATATLGLLGSSLVVGAASDSTLVVERLRAIAHQKECRVTTVGRKTGNPHTVTTWFIIDGDVVYLATLDPSRDWVRNARAKGDIGIDFGTLAVTGSFADVTDPAVVTRVRDAMVRKYWLAWLGSWFGKGPEAVFRVGDLKLVEP